MAALSQKLGADGVGSAASVLQQQVYGKTMGGDPKKSRKKGEVAGGTRAQRAVKKSSTVPVMSPLRSNLESKNLAKIV